MEVLRNSTLAKISVAIGLGGLGLMGCGGSNSAAETAPVARVLLPGSHHTEIEQFGANSFGDYLHASDIGPRIRKGAAVVVDCYFRGPKAAAPSTGGLWYHIEGPAKFSKLYAPANTFENGDTTGPISSQPSVDPKVPLCPKP